MHPIDAHIAVTKAVRAGLIIKEHECSNCGKVGRTEAHHFLGYDDQHVYDVRWLCRQCHAYADAQLRIRRIWHNLGL